MASTTDPSGRKLSSNVTYGKSSGDWASSPLASLPAPTFTLDRATYAPGDQPRLLFDCPYANATVLLVQGGQGTTRGTFRFREKGKP